MKAGVSSQSFETLRSEEDETVGVRFHDYDVEMHD